MAHCIICKRKFTILDPVNTCPVCYNNYTAFCGKELPEGWKKLTLGCRPSYDEWKKEQEIKSKLHDGLITQAEADKQAKELAETIRKKYQPTPEEMAERRRIYQERVAATTPAAEQMPSLFD